VGRLTNFLARGAKLPGMPEARHVAERAVAPYLRDDLAATLDRMVAVEAQISELQAKLERLERHQPTVLNAISTANGASRLLRRDLVETEARLMAHVGELREQMARLGPTIFADMSPHIDTVGWLLRRVETLRAEMLYELRYGRDITSADSEASVQPHLSRADGEIRLNIGCGHIPIEGYVNVDMRPLPGVDMVAGVDNLPVDPASVTEIFSAHLLEHFPEEQLRRQLLPYWWSLLEPGGRFRAVVPDSEAMVAAYAAGAIGFPELRRVIFGDQEYEGDFHFNAFTPQSLVEMLEKAGFVDVRVVETGRVNGDCLEAEVEATRPAHRDP
jgi:predicted SAM-dependent methyltransferase